MERTITPLTNPNKDQQQAWVAVNFALGALAASYHLNADQLNERAGHAVEAAVMELLPEVAA